MPDTDTHQGPGNGTKDHDHLLPIGQAAKFLGVSVGTLQRWDRKGILVALRTPTEQRRYRKADLLAAVKEAEK